MPYAVNSVSDRPFLLVIATGTRSYREYLLRSVGLAYRVHLFTSVEPSWERQHIVDWTVVDSTVDGPAMTAAALDLASDQIVDGVLCWTENQILAASEIAQALGLPGTDPDAVRRCRDKHQTRTVLDSARLPQPRSIAVTTLEEALRAMETVGYPAILKPRGLGGSLGVIKVRNPEELTASFEFTRNASVADVPSYVVPVLAEEYVSGPEISIDAVVYHGRVEPLYVARKLVGYDPYCEEIGHYVDATDPLISDPDMLQLLQSTHAALGVTERITHTEIKLTSSGPRVIEVNGRPGGDLIPYLGMRTTGIDAALVAAEVACGRTPDLSRDRKLAAGIRFYYVEQEDTTILSIGFDQERLPPAIDRAETLAKPGDTVSPPPKGLKFDRIAYATAVAQSVDECQDALDAAQEALRVEVA
jgi:biotin carboxylase